MNKLWPLPQHPTRRRKVKNSSIAPMGTRELVEMRIRWAEHDVKVARNELQEAKDNLAELRKELSDLGAAHKEGS